MANISFTIQKEAFYKFDGETEIVLSNLLNEIQDKSLQMILRRFIFNNEVLMDVLLDERPELKIKPDKLNKLKGK